METRRPIVALCLLLSCAALAPLSARAQTGGKPPSVAPDALARLFSPRPESDALLDAEKLSDAEPASVFPKLKKTDDAAADLLALLAASPHYLTEGDLRRMIRYFEWSLEAPLANSERNRLRRLLIERHDADGGAGSRAYSFLAEGVGFKIGNVYFDSLANPFEDFKRREIQRQRLPELRADAAKGDALAAYLIDRYEFVQPPLTEGPNPLRPQVARVYVEHVVFCLNEIAGAPQERPVVRPTPETALALARGLVVAWPKLSEARRKELSDLPFDWAGTLKSWPQKSEAEKTAARIAWGKQYAPLFPEVLPMHRKRLAAFEAAQAQAKAAAEKRAKEDAARLARLTPAQRAERLLADRQLALDLAMQSMQSNFRMQQLTVQSMSQMQNRLHQTNMGIIDNMRTGPTAWRYEYVWRP